MIPQVNKIKDLVIKAGTKIRIPKSTCESIIENVESVCAENLPHIVKLK